MIWHIDEKLFKDWSQSRTQVAEEERTGWLGYSMDASRVCLSFLVSWIVCDLSLRYFTVICSLLFFSISCYTFFQPSVSVLFTFCLYSAIF